MIWPNTLKCLHHVSIRAQASNNKDPLQCAHFLNKVYRKCISVDWLLKASALCACLPYICCFLTVAVRCREWRRKAAIFIQCLCEPYAAYWLNACHIDTPVVSPIGPQRHNGVGIGAASVCPWPLDSATHGPGRIRDAFVCSIERNTWPRKVLVHSNVERQASSVELLTFSPTYSGVSR